MNHEDTDKRFYKEIIDYFWNKESVVGTQRLSMNHIEKIKSFIHQEIERAVAEREAERNILSILTKDNQPKLT